MPTPTSLKRELGLFGAMMMGLGSIIGTGVFVSIGVAAGVAGPAVVLALAVGAVVASCNGLSSAQLAAAHPQSGGTYEYGYRFASPLLGFSAGWMFLWAKSASGATAALGFSGYLLNTLGGDAGKWLVPVAVAAVIAVTMVLLGGIRQTNTTNIVIVSMSLAALVFFIVAGLPKLFTNGGENFRPFFVPVNSSARGAFPGFLEACALMFVAYTGYGRIATLGEEVHDPRRTIPRAIIVTLAISMALYIGVGVVAVGVAGAPQFAAATSGQAAPLEIVSRLFDIPAAPFILALGAVTAMLGVLLNLVLGLSRVLLAMGRRGDMPPATARLDVGGRTPMLAVVVMGGVIALLALIGNVKTTWSFSAFAVLVYYAITNWCALRLPRELRLYPRWVAWCGLASCLFLAFFVQPLIWLIGLGLLIIGAGWHLMAVKWRS